VDYEWDPAKARVNFQKHGVHFSEAVTALEDEFALTIRDEYSDVEERWITLGRDSVGRVLVVVYSWRGERIRVISAWRAMRAERRQYEEGL
jgi:hypothetical protein